MRGGRTRTATLTAVLESSSEALLPPPCLLLMLRRLELRFVRIMALMGLALAVEGGEPGGEAIVGESGWGIDNGSAARCEEACAWEGADRWPMADGNG